MSHGTAAPPRTGAGDLHVRTPLSGIGFRLFWAFRHAHPRGSESAARETKDRRQVDLRSRRAAARHSRLLDEQVQPNSQRWV